MNFSALGMLNLLWIIPVLILFYAYASFKRSNALGKFAAAGLLGHLNRSISRKKRRIKWVLILISVATIVFALTRPSWNPKPKTIQRRGRDVAFVLDVSKSMLATDLMPNRLERSKLWINDCIDKIDGDRVALVVFAGNAVVRCPLTLDYSFFRMMLDQVNVDSVARGGTMMGDAIRKVLADVFDDLERQYKDIILITDGEDHDSFPVEAAKKAGEKGIRLIAVGIGNENEGSRIPITDEDGNRTFMKYKGKEIWTRLDADVLRKMVNSTPGGKYLNVATGTIDLGKVYTELVSAAEKREQEAKTIKLYEEKFQIFLAAAFVILCMEFLISERQTVKSVKAGSIVNKATL